MCTNIYIYIYIYIIKKYILWFYYKIIIHVLPKKYLFLNLILIIKLF